jgi:quercetin 2,3-dioxygenase
MSLRPVKQVVQSKPTMEGAGVRLRRAFGFGNTTDYDPFLLLDDFRNDTPQDYLKGFPWHPHRGIETITYVLAGNVEHADSLGNHGTLTGGDVQWMTAGSGIIHQEMPKGDDAGRMHGFQLWANLPSSLKMTAPRYQDVKAAEIPEIVDDDGTRVRVVVGKFWGKSGPVDGIAADPIYIDVSVPAGQRKTLPVEVSRHAFAYVFAGSGSFRDASDPQLVKTDGLDSTGAEVPGSIGNRSLILFDRGDEVVVRAGDEGVRFLLVSGKPLEEPVAWYGPIVMNTQEELQQAFTELRKRYLYQVTCLRHAGHFSRHSALLSPRNRLSVCSPHRRSLPRRPDGSFARCRSVVSTDGRRRRLAGCWVRASTPGSSPISRIYRPIRSSRRPISSSCERGRRMARSCRPPGRSA